MHTSTRIALLAVLFTAPAAPAATVTRLQPGAMAQRSEWVFIGTVSDQRTVEDETPSRIFTDTTFAIEQVVKGAKQNTFTLRQLGGVIGEGAQQKGTVVPGYARFTRGERVVLFLERTDTGRLVVAGLAQGKYTIEADPKTGTEMVVRDLEGLHMLGQVPDRVFAGAPADLNRMPLSQLLAQVAGWRPVPFAAPKVLRTPQVQLPAGDK